MEKSGDQDGAGDVEPELIAPQQALVAPALADFVRYGVEKVVAKVLKHPAVPGGLRSPVYLYRTVGSKAEVLGLKFEFLDRPVHFRLLPG